MLFKIDVTMSMFFFYFTLAIDSMYIMLILCNNVLDFFLDIHTFRYTTSVKAMKIIYCFYRVNNDKIKRFR